MNRIHAAGLRQRTRSPRDARYGMILLTEPTALIPDEKVRGRQRVIVHDLLKDARTRVAVVIAGQTTGATLLRSSSRGVVHSHPHLHLCDDAKDACAWLAQELDQSIEHLQSGLREARARAERELPAS